MAEKRERCHGSKEDFTSGKAHPPHWWKMYTRWCDGKPARAKSKVTKEK